MGCGSELVSGFILPLCSPFPVRRQGRNQFSPSMCNWPTADRHTSYTGLKPVLTAITYFWYYRQHPFAIIQAKQVLSVYNLNTNLSLHQPRDITLCEILSSICVYCQKEEPHLQVGHVHPQVRKETFLAC